MDGCATSAVDTWESGLDDGVAALDDEVATHAERDIA